MGNQLKNIVSGLKLADQIEDFVMLINPHSHIFSINNTFSPKNKDTHLSTWILAAQEPADKFNKLKIYREFLNADNGNFWYLSSNIDYQFENIKDEVIFQFKKYFKKIIFNPTILELVNQFIKNHPKFIGVHIRTWHDNTWRNQHFHDLNLFKKIMDKFPGHHFYISSDDISVVNDLSLSYPGRILSAPKYHTKTHTSRTNSVRVGIEAAVDLLILSKSQEIIGSYESTFTECAWWLADVIPSTPWWHGMGRPPPIHIPVPPVIINHSDPRPLIKNDARSVRLEAGGLNGSRVFNLLKKDNPIIIEIGSNNGETTENFLRFMPNAKIFCFEPDPRAIKKFKERINHPNVKLFECAIGRVNGPITFYQSSGYDENADWDQSGSIRIPKAHLQIYPWVKFDSQIKVQMVRLDDWLTEYNIEYIDLIWADIQGAESDMIISGTEALKRTHFLYTEYSNHECYEGQASLKEIDELLPEFMTSRLFNDDVLFENLNFVNKEYSRF